MSRQTIEDFVKFVPGPPSPPQKRVGIYTRTSTHDGRQYHENQLDKLREFAARMSWTVAAEFADSASGADKKRPELDKLMRAAARRSFDVVLVFDLSRLTRSGPVEAFALIERLNSSKVEFWSATEEHFRTSGPAGQLFIALAAYLATAERDTIRSRIHAGIARARKAGKTIGRPAVLIDRSKLDSMREQGNSIRRIAERLGVSKATIERALAAANQGGK